MGWTYAALADYLEMDERQYHRYLNKETYPRSEYFRRLLLKRLTIIGNDGKRIMPRRTPWSRQLKSQDSGRRRRK
jgi:hypothetical protein